MQVYFQSILWSYLPRVPIILTTTLYIYIYIYIYIYMFYNIIIIFIYIYNNIYIYYMYIYIYVFYMLCNILHNSLTFKRHQSIFFFLNYNISNRPNMWHQCMYRGICL